MNKLWRSLWLCPLLVVVAGCNVNTTALPSFTDAGDMPDLGMPESGTDSFIEADTGPGNQPPTIILTSVPGGPVSGLARYDYELVDAESDTVTLTITFEDPFFPTPTTPATEGPMSDGITGLSASPVGDPHSFVWASASDYVDVDVPGVMVCFTPCDAMGCGAVSCAPTVDVTNAPAGATTLRINEIGVGIPDYVEVINVGPNPVDITGWTLLFDSSAGAGAIPLPAEMIAAGAIVELRENNGPDSPTLIHIGMNILWDDAIDGAAELLDSAGNSVDFVRWGGNGSLPSAPGAWSEPGALATPSNDVEGLSRETPFDTDSSLDFCVAPATPQAANAPCPPPPTPVGVGDILITEVDTDPVADSIELFNTTGADINLGGMMLVTSDDGFIQTFSLPGVNLPAGGFVVVVDNAGAPGPGVIMLPDNINWSTANAIVAVLLEDAFGSGVDFVALGPAALAPSPPDAWMGSGPLPIPGTSASRIAPFVDTDSDADWCLATPSLGATSGACFAFVLAGDVDVVIAELSTGDPLDWVEIVNRGATDADISGWTLAITNGFGTMPFGYNIPAGAVVPAGGTLVIADGDPGVPFIDIGSNLVWQQFLGGSAALIDPVGTAEDFLRWGGNGTPAPAGTAWTEPMALTSPGAGEVLNRTMGDVDTDSSADWCVRTPDTVGATNPSCP